MSEKTILIDLRERPSVHRLSEGTWRNCAEAAAVTLHRFHAVPPPPTPAQLRISSGQARAGEIHWREPDAAERASHANEIDATEQGAYALAIGAVQGLEGWRILGRAQHASGADYLMVPEGGSDEEFVRLEVTGMAKGTGDAGLRELRRRLLVKIEQLGKGDLDRPGVAVAVGFELAWVLVSGVQR